MWGIGGTIHHKGQNRNAGLQLRWIYTFKYFIFSHEAVPNTKWQVLVQRDQSGSHAEVILNYTGGAYIYIRREYASRIRIIQRSWKTANKQAEDEMEEARGGGPWGHGKLRRIGGRHQTLAETDRRQTALLFNTFSVPLCVLSSLNCKAPKRLLITLNLSVCHA